MTGFLGTGFHTPSADSSMLLTGLKMSQHAASFVAASSPRRLPIAPNKYFSIAVASGGMTERVGIHPISNNARLASTARPISGNPAWWTGLACSRCLTFTSRWKSIRKRSESTIACTTAGQSSARIRAKPAVAEAFAFFGRASAPERSGRTVMSEELMMASFPTRPMTFATPAQRPHRTSPRCPSSPPPARAVRSLRRCRPDR
jgi:hypothetical protein